MRIPSNQGVGRSLQTLQADRPAAISWLSKGGRWLLVMFLAAHGVVHIMGFAAAWQWGNITTISRVPLLPAGLSAGSPPVLVLGIFWLVAAALFLYAAVRVAAREQWWQIVFITASAISLALCVAWWNDAWFGAIIDGVLLVGLGVFSLINRRKEA
jgi:hypothetical protein